MDLLIAIELKYIFFCYKIIPKFSHQKILLFGYVTVFSHQKMLFGYVAVFSLMALLLVSALLTDLEAATLVLPMSFVPFLLRCRLQRPHSAGCLIDRTFHIDRGEHVVVKLTVRHRCFCLGVKRKLSV